MAISPNHYVGAIKKANELIKQSSILISGKTEDGYIIPIIYCDDVAQLIKTLDTQIGKIELLIKGLQKDSSKHIDYSSTLNEMGQCRDELAKLVNP